MRLPTAPSLYITHDWEAQQQAVFTGVNRRAMRESLPETKIGWRKAGTAGAILLRRGEFEDARMLSGGKLKYTPFAEIEGALKKVVASSISLPHRLTHADFIGERSTVDIGYLLDPIFAGPTREAIRTTLEAINEKPIEWNEKEPIYLCVATISAEQATDEVLAAFNEAQPKHASLLAAQVKHS